MFKSFLRPVTKVVTKLDKVGDVAQAFEKLADKQVFVGIPEEKASRKGGKINNAELGYALSQGVRRADVRKEMKASQKAGMTYSQAMDAWTLAHGDPLWHVPPRPFLEPALDANKAKLALQQKKILLAACDGKPVEVEIQKLGMLGQNIVKAWFTDPRNNWPENAPATIKSKGSDRPNIDTGALRNAITYVVRGNK